MKFTEFITKKSIYVDVVADSQKNVFKILGNLFAKKNSTLSSKIIDNLNERERLGSTSIGNGVAIPHTKVEDIIKIAETSASCELWSVLKRPDEKFVTEKAFNNPKFVEDLVRDVAIKLQKLVNQNLISGFSVESENFESIHNHSAFALIDHNI